MSLPAFVNSEGLLLLLNNYFVRVMSRGKLTPLVTWQVSDPYEIVFSLFTDYGYLGGPYSMIEGIAIRSVKFIQMNVIVDQHNNTMPGSLPELPKMTLKLRFTGDANKSVGVPIRLVQQDVLKFLPLLDKRNPSFKPTTMSLLERHEIR